MLTIFWILGNDGRVFYVILYQLYQIKQGGLPFMQKQSNLSHLMDYAGERRYLTYLSLLLSVVSAALALFPVVFLFQIIREVIEVAPNYAEATHIIHNG